MNIFKSKKDVNTAPEKELELTISITLKENVKGWSSDAAKFVLTESKEVLTCTTDATSKDLKNEIEDAIAETVAKFERKLKESTHMTNGYHATKAAEEPTS
jgi:hypothetical protein